MTPISFQSLRTMGSTLKAEPTFTINFPLLNSFLHISRRRSVEQIQILRIPRAAAMCTSGTTLFIRSYYRRTQELVCETCSQNRGICMCCGACGIRVVLGLPGNAVPCSLSPTLGVMSCGFIPTALQ